ncbi:HlyD family type I secretion periplasmic adaptor subunit [Aquaspirillum serpens]|uniref:HlyD family type I secretion periplasmic adaptor subunit n=1 Tax=Aquaspirillum serpens TaxID=190 RepID=UPI0003B5CAD7|nr:HlyD family type I secretion periplasmic adaptor subunit [Aquaspirillum serpens]
MKWLENLFERGRGQTPEGQNPKVDTDASRVSRWGMWVLVGGFGLFMLWAATAPLDAGVPANGTVTVAGNRKTIQHLTGGTIDAIEVKDGQAVKKDQVLVRLNATQAEAQLGMTQAQYIIAAAVEARLSAERMNAEKIDFSPMLDKIPQQDERVGNAIALQEQLFQSRRTALRNEISILNENLAGAQQQLRGLEEVKVNRESQLRSLKQELTNIRDMADKGFVPRNRMFELERNVSQIAAGLAEDIANIGRTRNQISELKLRVLNRQQEYQKEVESQLTDVQKEVQSLADRMAALDYEAKNTLIRSPIDGTVVGLNIHTVGGVIRSGEPLMDVVPHNEPLIIQAQVPTNLIDKVHVGLPVEIQFPAFSHSQTPNIPGTVQVVAADSVVDQKTGMPYYSVKVQVTPEGMKMLGVHKIRPGMPATALLITGERTMLNYLLKPLIDRMNIAFTGD